MRTQSKRQAARRTSGPLACVETMEERALFSVAVVNGAFSLGNTGFTTQYVNVATPGGYKIGTNARTAFGGTFTSFGDHTTGSGLMFIADGALSLGKTVWQETITVYKGTKYTFSGWTASCGSDNPARIDPSPARLGFYVNGAKVGSTFTVAAQNGKWTKFSVDYLAPATSNAVVKIYDTNTAFVGNDFTLDDLSWDRTNLIPNGSFSAGITQFTTQYVNYATQGGFKVGTNPQTAFGGTFTSFGDHTTGKGLMFMADGALVANKTVWQNTIAVATGKTYVFTGWTASTGSDNPYHIDPSPAKLAFYVNGVKVGATYTVTAQNGKWTKFTAYWNSNTATTAVVKIVDTNTAFIGNDFALDDLSFMASA